PTLAPLQLDLSVDRVARGIAVGMKVRRSVVAFDDRDRPARLEQTFQRGERLVRLRQMLQQKANEDVIKRLALERWREEVCVPKLDVRQLRGSHTVTRFF